MDKIFINHPEIEKYIFSLLEDDDPVLKEMEKLAEKLNFPIVGRIVGKLLYLITKIKKPKLVVEIGSGFGYSGYWFAKALQGSGKLLLSDYKGENIQLAREFLGKANLDKNVIFEVGDGVEIAKRYKDIDILFLDHEKSRYKEAVEALKENLSKEALVIADNVLWYGKVLQPEQSKKVKAIDEFNRYMIKHFDTTIIPVRDGLLLAQRR